MSLDPAQSAATLADSWGSGVTAWELLLRLEREVLGRNLKGQVFTPEPVARWLAAAALDSGETGLCLDPAAGTGRLLLSVLERRCEGGADPVEVVEKDLVAVERDPLAAEVCRAVLCARAMELGAQRPPVPRVRVGDAFQGLPAVRHVVMNPPFGSADSLGSDFHAMTSARWPFARRQVDRAIFFMAAALEALEEGGRMAAIVPRYWLEATGASPFRAWLSRSCRVEQVLDLCDAQIWRKEQVLTAIVVLQARRPGPARFYRASAPSSDALGELWEAPGAVPASAYTVEACELGEMPWTHRAPEVERRIARLSEGCQRLGDHFKVGQGIKTGLNSVYVMDRERAAALSLPESIIRPTIEARQIQAGRLVGKEKVMLRVLGSTAISEHESLETYLEEHKGRLQRRYQVRKGACPWYALALPQNLHLMVAPQKIVTPLYSRTNRFAVDRGGCHVGTGVYVMVAVAEVPVSLEVVCAVLNSRPLAEFVRARAKLKRDGYLEFAGRLLRSLPLPPWGQEGWAELEGLVAADDGCEGGSARVRAEIDGVVAGLFGLEGGWG